MESGQSKVSISVIMGAYNPKDKNELNEAIDSILQQTYGDFEFLIYDDGSDAAGEELLKETAKRDGRIRLLRGETNRGLAHALNACLKEARGEFVARMDIDDISAPERFRVQKEFLDKYKEYGFVGGSAQLFDKQGVWGIRTPERTPGVKAFLKYSPYIHPSVMFRKSILDDAGGYLESEDTRRCEDYELFMRLYCKKQYGYNIDKVLFSYREDREWYDKRKLHQRIAEMKVRYRGFRSMGILKPNTLIYVVKPVLMIALPKSVRKYLRKRSIRTTE